MGHADEEVRDVYSKLKEDVIDGKSRTGSVHTPPLGIHTPDTSWSGRTK